jgi:hypothetical protein
LLVGVAALGLVTAPVAAADLQSFTSPSGNIGCIMDAQYLRCDIAERDCRHHRGRRTAPAYGYGQGIGLDPRPPAFVCAGDTTLHAGRPWTTGRRSEPADSPAGARLGCCANADGHGFRPSGQSYDIF